MEKKTFLILCFVCFIVYSDADLKVVRKHDGMEGMEPPPPSPMSPTSGNSDHHMNDTMNGMDSHDMSTMTHMTFFWGKNTEILFSGWPGKSTGMYVLALIFVFVLTVVVEWISHWPLMTVPGPRNVSAGIVQTVVHTVRIGVAYLVMLALMSFNGGVFIVAVLGHLIGFLIFGSRTLKKTNKESPPHDKVTADLPPVC